MKNAFQTRILAVVLAAATLAACVLAGLNLAAESSYSIPTDGIWWVETAAGLCAASVSSRFRRAPRGHSQGRHRASCRRPPGRAALQPTSAACLPTAPSPRRTTPILRSAKHCATALPQPTAKLDIQVILEPVDRSSNYGLRLIAVAYLLIGLYVLFRRWTAPKSTHFFVFCLVSFVLYAFKYTGQLDAFDQVIYWSNIVATALQPALFPAFRVHLLGACSRAPPSAATNAMFAALLYLPGLCLVALQVVAILRWSATQLLLHRLDKIAYGYMAHLLHLGRGPVLLARPTYGVPARAPAAQVAHPRHTGRRRSRLPCSMSCPSSPTGPSQRHSATSSSFR